MCCNFLIQSVTRNRYLVHTFFFIIIEQLRELDDRHQTHDTLAAYVNSRDQLDLSDANFQHKLDQVKDQIKAEMRKEYKIKDAAERMKKVSTDKRTLSNVNSIIRKTNTKLHDLQQELNELNAHQIVSPSTDPGTPTTAGS